MIAISNPAYCAPDNFTMLTNIMNAFSTSENPVSVEMATDKFKQANIASSYEVFSQILNNNDLSSVELLDLCEKMYQYGFFSLADIAKRKNIEPNFDFYIKTTEEFYSPQTLPTKEEELFFSQIYSNIIYNDRAVEAITELESQKDKYKKSDYVKYLLALGYFKTNNFKQSLSAIDDAIDINPKCENYKVLKIKLLAELGRRQDALRLFNEYNNAKVLPYSYRKKCELLKQFILYKTEKNQWERNYALGRYYYTEGDYNKALKSLQNATLTKNKKNLARVWGIMSRTYLKLGNKDKAREFANKCCKINPKNKDANVTLARLSDEKKEYKNALEHYIIASKDDRLDTSRIRVAQIYQIFEEDNKAEKIYKTLIKKEEDVWQASYNLSKIDKENREVLLDKTIVYNPHYKEAWFEKTDDCIESQDYTNAQKYLKNLLYIDEKDFRYYYYQGIIAREKGNNIEAVKYFQKSLTINPDNYEAAKALTELKEYI